MGGMNIFACRSKMAPNDFAIFTFIIAITVLFMIGHGLEWLYHIVLNPFAEEMDGVDKKKLFFYGYVFTLIVTAAALGILFWLESTSQLIFAIFGVVLVIIILMFKIREIKSKLKTLCKYSPCQGNAKNNMDVEKN